MTDLPWEVSMVVGMCFAALLISISYRLGRTAVSPFVVHSVYVGMGGSFVAYVVTGNLLVVLAGAALLLYIGCLYLGYFRYRTGDEMPAAPVRISERVMWGTAVAVLALIVLNLRINILSTGMSLGEAAEGRFRMREGNRLLFMAFMFCKPLIYVLVIRRGTTARNVLANCALWLHWSSIYLMGSKGVIFTVASDLVLFAFLKNEVMASPVPRSLRISIFKRTVFVFAASAAVLCSPFVVRAFRPGTTYMEGVEVIGNRLFTAFDSVTYAALAGLAPNSAPHGFWVWWAGSALKVLGVYPSEFNGVNHFIMAYYLGPSADQGGMFPNNTFIMEALLTLPAVVALVVVAAFAFVYGRIMAVARRYCRTSVVALLVFITLVANPFMLLIDGQSTATALLMSVPVIGVFALLNRLVQCADVKKGSLR